MLRPPISSPSISHHSFYIAPLLLQLVSAQHNAPLDAPTLPSSSSGSLPFGAAATTSAFPSATDHANYAASTSVPNSGTDEHSVLNYYFLLLAAFIIIIIILYFTLARKRKRRFAQATTRRQDALAADLGRWPGGGTGTMGYGPRTGRWHVLRTPRPQEGLDERGEAPPAYVAKPETAVHPPLGPGESHSEGFEMTSKPPDYEHIRDT